MVKPANRKQIVVHLKNNFAISERRACTLASVSRTGYRYKVKQRNDSDLRARLLELATQHSSYGYLFLHLLLRTEGLVKNKKRTYQIYIEQGPQVRTKKRKRLKRQRMPMIVPSTPNE